MKHFSILLVLLISLMSLSAVPVRTVSASTTIGTSDDNGFVTNTGAAVTFTLGTVSNGFSCTVANHGTGNVTFSGAITVANGQTITVLPKSASSIEPNIIGNSITLFYDGTTWRGQ